MSVSLRCLSILIHISQLPAACIQLATHQIFRHGEAYDDAVTVQLL